MKKLGALLLAVLVMSCAPAPQPTPTPFLTYTPYPTYTPFPTPASMPASRSAPASLGTTVIKPVEAKPSDRWASYLEGKVIQAIAVGRDCLWLGTEEGLIRFSKEGDRIIYTYYNQDDGLLGSDVRAVKVYDGEVWIGTADGGLSKFDGKKFTTYGEEEGLFDPRVMALDVNEDCVWLGLTQGLSRFDKRTETFQNWELPGGFGPEVGSGSGEGAKGGRHIYADSILIDGEYIWHAAYNLYRSDRDLTDSVRIGCEVLPDSRVTSICKDNDYMYIGTIKGLARLVLSSVDERPFRSRRYATREGLPSESVSALAMDGEYLWIGTDKGISRFNLRSEEIGCFEDYKGSPILSLAADRKHVWIGSLNGLYQLSRSAEPMVTGSAEPAAPPEKRPLVKGPGPLLANFEVGGPLWGQLEDLGVNWQILEHNKMKVKRYIDSTTGANGTNRSLCMEYELPPKLPDIEHICHCPLEFFIEKDLTPYEGITFFIREKPLFVERWSLFLEENGPHYRPEGRAVEVFEASFPSSIEWRRVVIPFEAFKLHEIEGVVNRIFDLPEVNLFHSVCSFRDWQAGQRGKIWIDEIRFYKKGEFEPTVPGRGTPVFR